MIMFTVFQLLLQADFCQKTGIIARNARNVVFFLCGYVSLRVQSGISNWTTAI